MKKLFLFGIILLTTSCENQTPQRRNPEFNATSGKTYTVAMLPPRVDIKYVPLTSDDTPMPEEEANVVALANKEMPSVLAQKNYVYRPANFKAADTQNLENEIQKQLNLMYMKLFLPESEAYNIHRTVGPEAQRFANEAGADLLLYINYKGYEKSSLLVAKDVAQTTLMYIFKVSGDDLMSPPADGELDTALIDGATGDILWSYEGSIMPLNEYSLDKERIGDSSPLWHILGNLPDKTIVKPKED